MPDNLTPKERSYAMSRIRSRGNISTEIRLVKIMRLAGISGWRRNCNLPGKPDFVFARSRIVVFVDGCFWHACRKCALRPKSNRKYWTPKMIGNTKRDRINTRTLRKGGWMVVRIWEHELKKTPTGCLNKIVDAMNGRRAVKARSSGRSSGSSSH